MHESHLDAWIGPARILHGLSVCPAQVPLQPSTVFRLLLACSVIVHKFLNDETLRMVYIAQIGGVTKTELLALEVEVLNLLQYKLVASPQEYDEMAMRLSQVRFPAVQAGCQGA